MKPEEIRLVFLEELTRVAPDIDAADVGADDDLMEDLEIELHGFSEIW